MVHDLFNEIGETGKKFIDGLFWDSLFSSPLQIVMNGMLVACLCCKAFSSICKCIDRMWNCCTCLLCDCFKLCKPCCKVEGTNLYLCNKSKRNRRLAIVRNGPETGSVYEETVESPVCYVKQLHKLQNTPYIDVTIHNVIEIPALLYTGAGHSLIDYEIVAQLPATGIRMTAIKPIAANGQSIELARESDVIISVEDVREMITMQVQRNATTPLLLGTNFLNRFKTVRAGLGKIRSYL